MTSTTPSEEGRVIGVKASTVLSVVETSVIRT